MAVTETQRSKTLAVVAVVLVVPTALALLAGRPLLVLALAVVAAEVIAADQRAHRAALRLAEMVATTPPLREAAPELLALVAQVHQAVAVLAAVPWLGLLTMDVTAATASSGQRLDSMGGLLVRAAVLAVAVFRQRRPEMPTVATAVCMERAAAVSEIVRPRRGLVVLALKASLSSPTRH